MPFRLWLIAGFALICAAAPAQEVVEDPQLVVLLRTTDAQSMHWYRDAYPDLRSVGWRIQIYHVPSVPQLGREAGPVFSLRGQIWEGYRDRASHYERLRGALRR